MKVLFLTNVDLVAFGIAETLNHLQPALARLGIEAVTYSSDPTARAGRMPCGGLCVHGPLPKPRFFASSADVRPLRQVCAEHAIAVVHCHGAYRAGWAARLLKRGAKVPYVVTSHGDLNRSASARARRFWVERRLRAILTEADAVTHISQFIARNAAEVAAVPGVMIPNGIDLPWWRTPTTPAAGNYVLALGRLLPTKGFWILLDALAAATRQGLALNLVLGGEGEDRDALVTRTRQLGLTLCASQDELARTPTGGVYFAGLVAGERKRALFAGATGVAFPSQPESPEAAPIVLLEAFAAGKMLLASDLPCVREVVTPEAGVLVPPCDVAAWTDALARLVGDVEGRKRIEARNARAAERYGWDEIAAQYAAVYRRVVTKRQAA